MIEQAKPLLHSQKDLAHTFTVLNDQVPSIRKLHSLSRKDQAFWVGRYVICGLGYLANRFDGYVETVSTAAWDALSRDVATMSVVADMQKAAIVELGFDKTLVEKLVTEEDQIYVLLRREAISTSFYDRTKYLEELCVILCQQEFIERAISRPLDALVSTAGMASLIRDFYNCREVVEPETDMFYTRSEAFKAYVLLRIQEREPSVAIPIKQKEVLDAYPEGIFTKLPDTGNLYYYTKEGTNSSRPDLS